MDASQAFAYHQNKGTLVPGQSISVNKYTVQVERYLSQGGFAHVYLVRTATPVYNTTHHVLKRIAVANEAMLTDVKKEVDIMRLLKGHPNIVHLIDAAWHRMSNGLYEVFILMEFCPGGGIIDMMNRRLRERLTEAEILQIFVDVCEGVAYMHNSRPPLLHRDLKVENILQASPTSFKLCDFGSATTVATRPPANMQEIRALEEDLNRHTTLQYRAPEMIDAHLRRLIDEKSDVWALGVLLYKLCYYTTPFEEHGPLAILNVQYRIPPYPVYSPQMNALIASMLREHGTQRPSVFEVLVQVHRLRGTKSQFQYNIPQPQPLAPRIQPQQKSPSPNHVHSTISYRQGPPMAVAVNGVSTNLSATSLMPKNAGVQARDKVLEAIAPMRRGRPIPSQERSRSNSPAKAAEPAKEKNWLEDEEKAWQAVTSKSADINKSHEDGWNIGSDRASSKAGQRGFGDDFGEQLWKSNPNPPLMKPTVSSNSGLKAPGRPPLSHRISDQPLKPVARMQEKDAFDGLGLSLNNAPAPTLAEARKLRTGLAISVNQYHNGKYGHNLPVPKPSPSPKASYASSSSGPQSSGITAAPLKQDASGSSWSSQAPLSRSDSSQAQSADTLSAEYKFPTLEELDASFAPGHNRKRTTSSIQPVPHVPSEPQLSNKLNVIKPISTATSNSSRPPSSTTSFRTDGVRTEQVSGVAMRAGVSSPAIDALKATKTPSSGSMSRGNSVRKPHNSSATKAAPERNNGHHNPSNSSSSQTPVSSEIAPRLPARPSQRDWLTGDDNLFEVSSPVTRTAETSQPVLRDSPSKRVSYIEKSHIPIQQAIAVTPESLPPESSFRRVHRVFPELENTAEPARVERLTENWSPVTTSAPQQLKESDTSSSADEEGPEDVTRSIPASSNVKKRRKGRQSSVHDLVDLWGGGGGQVSPEKNRETRKDSARATMTPLPKSDGIAKRRSVATPTPIIPTNQRSISPQPVSSPSPSRPPATSASQQNDITNPTSFKSTNVASANSSRSRPQSMFIFPSKSTDGSALPSAGLGPPEAPQTRTTRRTSISDMVQRYEAIDAVARTGIPSASSRNLPHKVPGSQTEKDTSLQASSSKRDGHGNENSSTVDDTPSSTRTRSASSGIPRPSPNKHSTASEEHPEMATPRARRISTRPDAQNPFPPMRKPTLVGEEPSRSGDIRSPSPERPYQGVGKLIDQWQRKTVESEATRTPIPKRGGLVAKRAALVNGGN
ncbi:hypothetical protein GGU10DRAFT_305522 [Lentinula aff. detonsa]|uniref:non-specific serine/threonine protein kinase n=1 Tax=Lentinula aff. detonsa TaxID=2804958 RepID=A0AA38TXY3_9AGAR|nr:hypothetical protein GGU10DRAFT_305522 [Lentinula aff. detonsa]